MKMATFNLRRARNPRPIDELRRLPGCSDIRADDMCDITDDEMRKLASSAKTAMHGRADGLYEMPSAGYNPYNTDIRVRTPGGNVDRGWNKLPSSNNRIDEDGSEEKSTRGNDPDEYLRNKKITDLMEGDLENLSGAYIVRLLLKDTEDPDEVGNKYFGDLHWNSDGKSISMIVDDFQEASRLQQQIPGSVVEKRRQKDAK